MVLWNSIPRGVGWPSPEAFQGQVEWDFEQLGVPARGRMDGLGDVWWSLSTQIILWLSSQTLIKIPWKLAEQVWELPEMLNDPLGLKPSFCETVLCLFLFAQWFSLLLAL